MILAGKFALTCALVAAAVTCFTKGQKWVGSVFLVISLLCTGYLMSLGE